MPNTVLGKNFEKSEKKVSSLPLSRQKRGVTKKQFFIS